MIPVLTGELPLKVHAHQANDIGAAIRIAREFGLKIMLDHCTEGHLIAPLLAVNHGMDPFEALKAITVNPARMLGLEHRIGTLEVGKDADLVVTDGDPLVSSTRVIRTYVNGRPVE